MMYKKIETYDWKFDFHEGRASVLQDGRLFFIDLDMNHIVAD